MASRLTKDGIKLSQSSDLATTSASVSVPLNLNPGEYWNFNSVYVTSSNASSTPTAEDLRETAAWNTGVSSNLVVTFTHTLSGSTNSTTASRNIGGIEILGNVGSDGLSTIKDVKLEVSDDAVNYTTVVDNLELPSTSSSKPAYILLPTEFLGSIGHPLKDNSSGYGYNHFRLTIKNGYSSDSIKISKILLRPTTLKRNLTSVSSKPAVFNSNTSLIAGGEISSTDVNMTTTTQSLDDYLVGIESDIAANTSAISNTSTTLSMADFTTNLFLDLTLVSNPAHNTDILYGPATQSAMDHTVAPFQDFKNNATYMNSFSLKLYSGDSTHEIRITDLINFNSPTGPTAQTPFTYQYDNEHFRDGAGYIYFVGNDLVINNGVLSGGGAQHVQPIYRIDIIR